MANNFEVKGHGFSKNEESKSVSAMVEQIKIDEESLCPGISENTTRDKEECQIVTVRNLELNQGAICKVKANEGVMEATPNIMPVKHQDQTILMEGLITERLEEWGLTKPNLISQLMVVNKNLEQQITTLRLRLDFDNKHHEASMLAAEQQMDMKVKSKDREIDNLRVSVDIKDNKIRSLANETKQKGKEIGDLEQKISHMKKDLDSTRKYASELHRELASLHSANKRLEKGIAFDDKDKEIQNLISEIEVLNLNISKLETELDKAKQIISRQGGKIRILENEKNNMHLKLKEELSKLSLSMRFEIEKMREVMKQQWDEMKVVREQNENLREDLKEIKDLLINSQPPTHRANETARGVPHGRSLKPTFPPLGRETKRILPGRKK